MPQGRGGMGMHKHGVSGVSGPDRRDLLLRAIERNRWDVERCKILQNQREQMFSSVQELMRDIHKTK